MIFHGFLSTITSFIDEITPHICNMCFVTFLVCSEAYLFWTNLKNKTGFGIGKDRLNMAADVFGWFPFITCILSVSNQSCSGNVRPTLKVSFCTFLLNYVKKVDCHNSNLLLDLTFSSNVMLLYRVVIYDLLHTGLHLRPSKSQ